jgi:hypothetical protein
MPANNFDQETVFLNEGFIFEQQRLRDPNNPAAGTVPFHRQYITGDLSLLSASGRDKDRLLRPGHLEAGRAVDDDAGRPGGPRAAL